MSKNIKLSPICAGAAAVLLAAVRLIQLMTGVDVPSGLYTVGADFINILYGVLMVICAAGLAVTAYYDSKRYDADIFSLSSKRQMLLGFFLILAGAAMAATLFGEMSDGIGFVQIIEIIGTVTLLAFGMTVITGGVKVYMCLLAVLLVIVYILRCIFFYVSHPIITGIPQNLMIMAIYVLTLLFWINLGRIISGGEKRLTRTAVIASGLATGCAWFAYVSSSMLLMLFDGEKWLKLASTPDLEMIIGGAVPALIALTMLIGAKEIAGEQHNSTKTDTVISADKDEPIMADEDDDTTANDTAVTADEEQDNSTVFDTDNSVDDDSGNSTNTDTPDTEDGVDNEPEDKPVDEPEEELGNKSYDDSKKYDLDEILKKYSKE